MKATSWLMARTFQAGIHYPAGTFYFYYLLPQMCKLSLQAKFLGYGFL